MRLTSHGTGGARRRLRYHSERHRALTWSGLSLGDLVFEVHADDGRTYTLKLDDADVAEVVRGAAEKAKRARKRAGGGNYRKRGATGQRRAQSPG